MLLATSNQTKGPGAGRPGQRRLAAIFEICGVYMVGLLIAYVLTLALGIKLMNPLDVLAANPNADLLEMSKELAMLLLMQYAGILPVAFVVGWWHRRRKLADYGLTTAGKPLSFHLLAGIVLFSVSELPYKLLALIDHLVPLGPKAVYQQIAYGLDWSDYRFWIFMAVGSFLLVPIVEELFYRGYVQTRLAEDFGAPAAILMTGFFFMFSHGQYYAPSPWNAGMLLTGVFEALIWGYVFYRTRSIIAPMIAHALVNFPVRGAVDFILPVIMAGIAIVCRRHIAEEIRKIGSLLKHEIPSKAATVLGIAYMTLFASLVSLSQDAALILGIVLMIAGLILEILEKRQQKSALQPAAAA